MSVKNRHLPRFEFGHHRLMIMESLDKIIDFSVRDNKRDEKSNSTKILTT